jgi:prophage regulatory protein
MRFIRPGEVVKMIGVSRTTLWRMVRDGLFPSPIRITTRNRGYVLDDVEAWMRARVERAAGVEAPEGTLPPARCGGRSLIQPANRVQADVASLGSPRSTSARRRPGW